MHPSRKTFFCLLLFAVFSLDVELLFCRFSSILDVAEELSKIPKIIHPIPQIQKISLLLDPLRKQSLFLHTICFDSIHRRARLMIVAVANAKKPHTENS